MAAGAASRDRRGRAGDDGGAGQTLRGGGFAELLAAVGLARTGGRRWRPLCWATCPISASGRGVLGFVTTGGYLGEEGFADGEGFWLVALARAAFGNVRGLTTAYLLVAAGTMAWLGIRAAWRADHAPTETLRDIAVLLMAGMFVLSPNYPWYFLVVVPVHRARRRRGCVGHDAGRAPALPADLSA